MTMIGRVLKSQLFKDGVVLFSGNVWAQLIAFVAYLILTRLFSPEDIGIYNIFYSYIEVLIIVSTGKYEMAIVLADNDREAAALSRMTLRLNAIISSAMLLILTLLHLLFPDSPLSFLNKHFFIAALIPPMVFFCGTTRVYSALNNRFRQFRQIAMSEVVGSSSGVLFKVLFGLPRLAATAFHTIGLPLGTVLGKAASNFYYLFTLRKLNLPSDISKTERRNAAHRFRNFPLYTMPKDLVNSLSSNLPFIWLALYFDKAEVGLFSLALTFTFRPTNILNNVFEKLLYIRVADKVREHLTIKSDIIRFMRYVFLAALPLCVIMFFFADDIFGFLFGGRWKNCGFYIRSLLPWIYLVLLSSSLSFLSNVFTRQRTEFVFYIILLLLRVAAVVTGITTHNFRLAIMLFAAGGAVISVSLLIWYLHLVERYEHSEVIR